jgi:DNA modification methylase
VTKKPLDYIAAPLRKLAVSIDELRADPRNARRHDARNLGELEASLRRFGQRLPIIVRRAGMVVIVGNARLNLARRLGWSHLAAVILDDDEATARAYALADNRIGELGEWDDAGLAQTLLELSALDDDQALEGLGWNRDEVGAMVAELEHDLAGLEDEILGQSEEEEVDQVDDVESLVEGIVAQGDVWELGAHRLFCGDCLTGEALKDLLLDARVRCVVTDPPYAIYGSSTGVESDVADAKMVEPFFREVGALIWDALPDFGHAYVCCDWRSYPVVARGFQGAKLSPLNLIVWDKGDFGLGSHYRNCHEFVGYFGRVPKRTSCDSRVKARTGHRSVHEPNVVRMNRTGQGGFEGENERGKRYHNAAKPVALLESFVRNSTDHGDTVLDPFLGAGSTLLAAERTGRVCYGVDIEPKWIEVAIRRWESLTGKEATKAAATGAATP